jgi:4-amino-4-deoxy-L-arabinose transferase-like glycosyltransferase
LLLPAFSRQLMATMIRHRSLAYRLIPLSTLFLLLYAWTLTESAPLRVRVDKGFCTAELGQRSSTIVCPEVEGGRVGLFLTHTPPLLRLRSRPLDLFVPRAAWERVTVRASAAGAEEAVNLRLSAGSPRASGRLGTTYIWPSPEVGGYEINAFVQHPDGEYAGVLLLQADSDNGYAFMIDSENRQGTWWQWRDGQRAGGIGGAPYQKPIPAQLRSLLRQLLATFFGALFFIVSAAALSAFARRLSLAGRMAAAGNRLKGACCQHPTVCLVPLMLLLFVLTIHIAVDRLQTMPHVQDSVTYLFQAQTLAGGALWAPAPPLPDAFRQEFLMVAGNKWFGQYPPGYPALMAIGVLAGAPWLTNPWLVVPVMALLFRLGALLYRRDTGVLAAALGLASPFFVILSGSLMVHTAELLWALAGMVGWTLALRQPYRMRWALVAGAALGMLLLTRQITAVVLGLSFFTGLWAMELMAQRAGSLPPMRRPLFRQGLLSGTAALPFLLLLLGYQAAVTGSPWDDPRLLGRPFDRPGFGSDIGERQNAFRLAPEAEGIAVTWYTDDDQPPRGHSLARGLFNMEQNVEALASHLFGWFPLLALAFCWLPFLLARPARHDWLLLLTLFAVLAIYVLYWTTGIMYGPRYYFAALPALLLLTARGLQILARRVGPSGTAVVFGLLLLGALLYYWPGTLRDLRGYNFISGDDRAQVEAQLAEPALVFVPGDAWWDYGRFFSGNTPWLDGVIIYARDRDPQQNACLLQAYPQRAGYLWHAETRTLTALPSTSALCPPAMSTLSP